MIKMSLSNIGDPMFEWLEDYSLHVIGIDAGYRYINTDHYVYFDVSLDIVTVVWFFWQIGRAMASDENEKPLKGERLPHR
jgi:hypothetical protein